MHSLKEKLKQQSEEVALKYESKDQLKEHLNQNLAAYQKDKQVLEIQLEAEKEKH